MIRFGLYTVNTENELKILLIEKLRYLEGNYYAAALNINVPAIALYEKLKELKICYKRFIPAPREPSMESRYAAARAASYNLYVSPPNLHTPLVYGGLGGGAGAGGSGGNVNDAEGREQSIFTAQAAYRHYTAGIWNNIPSNEAVVETLRVYDDEE